VSLSFRIGEPRLARRDLALPAADILDRLSVDSSNIALLAPGEGATVSGLARDSLGKPVVDARITISGVAGEWRTSRTGNFVVHGIPSGARVVSSTQPGFLPERRLVDLADRDSVGVDLSMTRIVTVLDTLKITGKQGRLNSTLLDIASRKKLGFGYRTDSLAMSKLPSYDLREAFNFPSVRVIKPNGGPWVILMRNHAMSLTTDPRVQDCIPTIFVDGMRYDMYYLRDLTKEEIALVEVFTSPSSAPSEYAGSGGNCGIVLVWRKRYLRP
jgi:hypothetical protein